MQLGLRKLLFSSRLLPAIYTAGLFLLTTGLRAQEILSFQLDIGGAAPYRSINIEKRIFKKTAIEIRVRAGIGFTLIEVIEPPRVYLRPGPSFPAGVMFLVGKEKSSSKFEIGVQQTYIREMTIPEIWDEDLIYKENIKNTVLTSFFAGYRLHLFKQRGIVRIGYNPVLLGKKINSWAVLSLGWTLHKRKKLFE